MPCRRPPSHKSRTSPTPPDDSLVANAIAISREGGTKATTPSGAPGTLVFGDSTCDDYVALPIASDRPTEGDDSELRERLAALFGPIPVEIEA